MFRRLPLTHSYLIYPKLMSFIHCYIQISAFWGDFGPLITQVKALLASHCYINEILWFPDILSVDSNLIMNDLHPVRLGFLLFYAVFPILGHF